MCLFQNYLMETNDKCLCILSPRKDVIKDKWGSFSLDKKAKPQTIIVFSKHFRLIYKKNFTSYWRIWLFFFRSYCFVYRVGCTRSHDSVSEVLIGHGVLYFLTRIFKIILRLFYYIRNHMFFWNPRCWDYRQTPFHWTVPPTKKLRTKCVFRLVWE